MKLAIAICVLIMLSAGSASAATWQPSQGHAQVRLWPSEPATPDSEAVGPAQKNVGGRPWIYVSKVSRPTLTVYRPQGRNTGAAMLVFPGGGYEILAIDLEGTEICDWLTSKGITAVLVKYRVPHNGPNWDRPRGAYRNTGSSMALEDAQRAISVVRSHAAEWKIDPHKIGVIGFSAGGHIVASVSTRFDHRVYTPVDPADQQSCRPDFAVAVYPGHLFDYYKSELNSDLHVTKDTPATFLVHAENDPVDGPSHTLVYYEALKNAGVPVELHMYAEGGHAFGLRPTRFPITRWPQLVETWLRTIGMTSR